MRILALLLALLSATGFAEKVTLDGGKTIRGRIVSRTDETLIIESGGMILTIPGERVTAVEADDPFADSLLRAETAFRRGDAYEGIDMLFKARKEGAPAAEIQKLMMDMNRAISSAIASADADRKAGIDRSMKSIMEANLLTGRALYFAAQNFVQLEDFAAAETALGRIPTADLREDGVMRAFALDFFRANVQRHLNRGEFENAVQGIENMRLLVTNGEEGTHVTLARLAQSAAAREAGNYKEAFRVIVEDLLPVVPEIARNRTIHTVESLKNSVDQSRKYAEALDAIEILRDVYPIEYVRTRNYLVERQANALLDDDRSEAATAMIGAIEEELRTPEMTRIYNVAQHETAMRTLDESQPVELLNHALWCIDHELYEEALLILAKTGTNPQLKQVSDEAASNARRQLDTRLLQQAQASYDLGDMPAVTAAVNRIVNRLDRGSALRDEAERLATLADQSMKREKEMRGVTAEILYQQAERAFFLQHFDESLKYIDVILRQYADTPAGGRASRLLPDAIRALEIAYLEGRTTSLPAIKQEYSAEQMQKSDRISAEIKGLLDAMNEEKQ